MRPKGQESVIRRQPGWSRKTGEAFSVNEVSTDWPGLRDGWRTTQRADAGLKLKTGITVCNPLALARI